MQAVLGDDLRLYPPPNADQLKQAIADYYQLAVNQVFVGNGSDEVLAHVFNGLFRHAEPILFPDITYSFYPVYCGLYNIDYKCVPLTKDFTLQTSDYRQPNGGIIFPNPNAPTGCLLGLEEIEVLVETNRDSVVVIDEAYIDFGGESAAPLVGQYPNLLVIQTLSKSRALAGLRVGFALGAVDLIEGLERVKNSFNSYPLGQPAIAGAVAAIKDQKHFEDSCKKIIDSREQLSERLQTLGFEVLPSAANFVFVRHKTHSAEDILVALRDKDIIVRHFKKPRIEQFLRITVGTEEQNTLLVDALKTVLG